jgi:RimJ/RimL family protein N-acetyltransferase
MPHFTLRRIRSDDGVAFQALLAVPEVKHFLTDGETRTLDDVRRFVAKSDADFAAAGIGAWLLEDGTGVSRGCVWLQLDATGRAAELSYLLAPDLWGQGIATRMAATAIREAFRSGTIERVFAGADLPNSRSFAVMHRLGMRYARDVVYTVYPGKEYEIGPAEAVAAAWPDPLPIESPGATTR